VRERARVVFSAHGVSPAVHAQAAARHLATIDATCPLVSKVHKQAIRFAKEDYDIILVGHTGHEEVEGTQGEAPERIQVVNGPHEVDQVQVRDPQKVVWISQTTLSVDETLETVRLLRERFPAPPPLQGTAEVLGRRPSGIHLRRTRWRTPAADMGVSSPMTGKYHQWRK